MNGVWKVLYTNNPIMIAQTRDNPIFWLVNYKKKQCSLKINIKSRWFIT